MIRDDALLADGDAALDDGLPLYLQVASTLRTAIHRDIYPVGTRLPTEDALCQRFKVSRHTIREALRRLRDEGLITSRPGSRPTVAPPAPRAPEVIAGDMGRDFFDYTIGTRLEIAAMETVRMPQPWAADIAPLAEGEWLYVTGYRINVDDGRPTCWNEYFIRAEFALVGRLLARHVGPVIPLLEDLFEQRITRITRSIGAVELSAGQAGRFARPEGAAALRIVVGCEIASGATAMVNRSVHPQGEVSYAIRR